MTINEETTAHIEVYPATAGRWNDLETLFGAHGASEDCWCLFWRLRRKDFNKLTGEERKASLKERSMDDKIPGLLAYVDGEVAGWCSMAPREQYQALENSRKFKRIDNKPVWSIVCFYIHKTYRSHGLMDALLGAAIDYGRQNGAKIIEAYPTDTQSPKLAGQKLTGDGGYMGIASIFRKVGFVEVGRASETKLIMRYTIEEQS